MDELLNVHQVLANAKDGEPEYEEEASIELKPFSIRVLPALKSKASLICRANGKCLGSFLRGCMETLVREYQ